MVARYGGEEFAVILPNTNERGAKNVAEKLRLEVKAMEVAHPRSSVSSYVTISIGMATLVPTEDSSLLDFLHDVDMALYRAKENGRDQIVHIATPVPAFGLD